MIELVVSKNDSNQTLLNFLKKSFKNEPLSKIYYLFYKKKIRVNAKKITNFKYVVQENDLIQIYDNQIKLVNNKFKIPTNPNVQPQIIYQDEHILIVVKDHNVVTHSPKVDALDNVVRYYLAKKEPSLFDSQTFTISHLYRLDKLTKGMIIYPKTKLAQRTLIQAQTKGSIIKKYLALCEGKLTTTIVAEGYIYQDEINQKMVFSQQYEKNAKKCQTIIKPVKFTGGFSLLECQLVTGRKHQIRATLAFLNLVIVGDCKYGSVHHLDNQILLFAYYLKFQNLNEPLVYLNNQEFVLHSSFKVIETFLQLNH